MSACVDHRLDSNALSLFELAHSFAVRVMRNVWRWVKQRVDAVANEVADHVASLGFGVRLNDIANVSDQCSGLYKLDRLVEALPCSLDDQYRFRISLGFVAYVVGLVQIAVVPAVIKGDVDVQDVAIDEGSLVWNTVADDLVEGSANRFGEVVVVEW